MTMPAAALPGASIGSAPEARAAVGSAEGGITPAAAVIGRVTGQTGVVHTLAGPRLATVEVFATADTVQLAVDVHANRGVAAAALVRSDHTALTSSADAGRGVGIKAVGVLQAGHASGGSTEGRLPATARMVGRVAGSASGVYALGRVGVEAMAVVDAAHALGPLGPDDTEPRVGRTPRVIGRVAGRANVIYALVAAAVGIDPTGQTLAAVGGAERGVAPTAGVGGRIAS